MGSWGDGTRTGLQDGEFGEVSGEQEAEGTWRRGEGMWAGRGEVPVCRHLRKGRDQREAEAEMAEPGKAEADNL